MDEGGGRLGWAMARIGLPIAAVVILLDQLTKLFARGALWDPPRRLDVVGFLSLVPVQNEGISFGLFQTGTDSGRWIISGIAIAVAIGLGVWLMRLARVFPTVALGLVIGGALGNVIDRMRLGWVIDFIDFHVGEWHWPAFNLADSAIAVGVALLVIDGLLRPTKKPR